MVFLSFFLFLVVYLSLALNSSVKSFSLLHANEKLYDINIAKYTGKITKLQWKSFTLYFIIIITIINIYSGSIYKYNGSSPYKLKKL